MKISTSLPTAESAQHKKAVLLIVLASYLMIVLDISIVITGLPKIRDSLGFTAATLSWVHTAYTLSFGGLLMAGARAGDLFGRQRMFVLGLAIFVLASLAIGLAPSPGFLVAARAMQGMGSAILAPATLALLSVTFTEGVERTKALGWYGATAGVGASVGMVLGGVLADLLSWRVGFFINVPLGIALIWAAVRFIKETPRHPGKLDLPGAILSTLGMVSLVYGLVEAAETGWTSLHSWVPLLASVVLLTAFFVHEGQTSQPLLPLRLFSNRARSGAYAARLLFLAGVIGFWFYLTQYLQGVLGMRPLQAGMAFLPATLVQLVAAMSVSRMTQRIGNELTLAIGMGMTMIGMVWLAQVDAASSYITSVALPMMVLGIGQGWTLSPLTIAGVAGVAPQDAGAASGLVNTSHQLGGSVGLAMLVVVFSLSNSQTGDVKVDLAHRVASSLGASAVLLLIAFVVVLTCIVRQPSKSSTASRSSTE